MAKGKYAFTPMLYCPPKEVEEIAKRKGLTPIVEGVNHVRLVRVLSAERYKITWRMFWLLLQEKGLAVFKTQYGEFLKIINYDKNIFHTIKAYQDRGETFKRPDLLRESSHD